MFQSHFIISLGEAINNLATSKNHLYNYLNNFQNIYMPKNSSKAITDIYLAKCLKNECKLFYKGEVST